jgi:hypothetical protein
LGGFKTIVDALLLWRNRDVVAASALLPAQQKIVAIQALELSPVV